MTQELPARCGNCRFGQRIDVKTVECWGAPPTPVPMAAGQDMAGRPAMMIQLLRPRLAITEKPCAVWQRGEQVPLIGLPTPGAKHDA